MVAALPEQRTPVLLEMTGPDRAVSRHELQRLSNDIGAREVCSAPAYFRDGSDASVALALGLRASAGHGHHQGFVELALLPVDADVIGHVEFPPRISLLYGLGLQLGYRLTLTHGLTVNVLGGPGYALNKDVAGSRLKPLIGFGFGYAWPRH